jgi:hypothetical protein
MGRRVGVGALLVVTLGGPVLASAHTLEVVDGKGRPVAGVRVEIWAVPATGSLFERLDPMVAEGESGSDGKVELVVPRLGELLWVVDSPSHPTRLIAVAGPPPPRVILPAGLALWGRARPAGDGEPGDAVRLRGAGLRAEAGEACARWQLDLPGLDRTRSSERCAELSPSGEFSMEGLPADPVELTISVPGFLPERRQVAAGGEPLALALTAGARVSGKVMGPGGGAVAGATLRAAPGLEVQSGEDGSFLLTVPALPVEISVAADGYLAAREIVRATDAPLQVLVHLERGQVVSGELLGDGEPIERATFRIHRQVRSSWSADSREVELSDGAFRLSLPEPGHYRLRVQAEGYRETVVAELEIGAGEELALGTLVASRGAGARGRLVDEATGEPVPGGVVEMIPRGSQIVEQALRGSSPRAISDEEGGFLVTGLEAGSYDLRAKLDGRAPALRELDLTQDEVRDVGELELGAGVTVIGRVRDRVGAPRPGVEVSFFSGDGESLQPLEERWTDARGSFEGPTLAPGVYQVRVQGERRLLTQRVEIPEGVERHELELTAGGVALHGVVLQNGAPVDGGLLVFASQLDPGLRRGLVVLHTGGSLQGSDSRFNAPESETAADVGPDGTFRVEDAPTGSLLARFYGLEGREITRRVEVPDQPEAWVVIELAGAALAGSVVDDATGTGIEASIRVLTAAGQPAAVVTADVAGDFLLADLQPGRYRLEVTAQGYRPFVANEVRVEAGREPLLVRLEPGGTGALSVRLGRDDGSPLSRVQFTLLDANGVMVRSLLSDWNGEKLFQGLAEGAYVVVWSDTLSGTGASTPIQVASGETSGYRATLPAASSVSLLCEPSLCGGEGLDRLEVLVPAGLEITSYLAGAHVGMRFSESGSLALGRLTPGRYLLRARAGGLYAERILDLRGGEVVVSLE